MDLLAAAYDSDASGGEAKAEDVARASCSVKRVRRDAQHVPGSYVSKRRRALAGNAAAASGAPEAIGGAADDRASRGVAGVGAWLDPASCPPAPSAAGCSTRPPSSALWASRGAHERAVSCVRWNPAFPHLLASAGLDGMLRVWQAVTAEDCAQAGPARPRPARGAGVLDAATAGHKDAAWAADGLSAVTVGFHCQARVVDTATGALLHALAHEHATTCVCMHPTHAELFLVGGERGGIVCWDLRTQSSVGAFKAEFGSVHSLAFLDAGGTRFVSCADITRKNSLDKGVIVWDFDARSMSSSQVYLEGFTCTCVAVHPQGRHFVAQSHGDYIAQFSASPPFRLNKYKRFEGHRSAGYSVRCSFSADDGAMLASGSSDGCLFVYDARTARVLRRLRAHEAACLDAAFHPALPSIVASCSWDGDVCVFR